MEIINIEPLNSEIIFKQLDLDDFANYNVVKEDIIVPTLQGYIGNQINEIIDRTFLDKETVVINAGVGQGKTHTIMEIASKYYLQGFCLVFAVPYKSLIDQYKSELISKRIPLKAILDYRNIDDVSPTKYKDYQIHLVTINSILGNPGDEFLMQSEKKIEYFNAIISNLENKNKKAVIIMDEVHDGVHNFKEKYIFSLWKWRNCLLKFYLISATFNEASKIVIKHLADITDKKIRILESARIKIEEKQSELTLIIHNKQSYDFTDNNFINFFQELIDRDKKINILSYSKTKAIDIASSEIGKSLKRKYGENNINLCISSSDNEDNRFDITKCNIGTKFSTGINILGNDSAFVILLPSQYDNRKRTFGIFSSGINTLIQAVARVRDKSEVHIIMPMPSSLINSSIQTEDYIEKVTSLRQFSHLTYREEYKCLNNQKPLIDRFYSIWRNNVKPEIEFLLENRDNNEISLNFPTLDDYILSDGEKYLYSKYDIFGKDLSKYAIWASFNNQFLNCKLSKICFLQDTLLLDENKISNDLNKFIYDKFYEHNPLFDILYSMDFQFLSDIESYQKLRATIFDNPVFIESNTSIQKSIKSYSSINFEKSILTLFQLRKKGNNIFSKDYLCPPNNKGFRTINEEVSYEDYEYLLSSFSHSLRPSFDYINIPHKDKLLTLSYRALAYFFIFFEFRFTEKDDNGNKILWNNMYSNFITMGEAKLLLKSIKHINKYDILISNKIFNLMRDFKNYDLGSEKGFLKFTTNIYKLYKSLFFKLSSTAKKIISGETRRYEIIEQRKEIPHHSDAINLIFTPPNPWWDNLTMLGTGIESE